MDILKTVAEIMPVVAFMCTHACTQSFANELSESIFFNYTILRVVIYALLL